MNRILLSIVLCIATLPASASLNSVKVHVRVILVDKDLNQKPVPFFVVSIKGASKTVEVKTGLDGSIETQLPPGKYIVTSAKPAELGGKRFTWDIRITCSGA